MAGGGDSSEDGQVGGRVEDLMIDEDEENVNVVLERVQLEYRPTYQRFVVKEKSFTQQYSHLYTQRLVQMRDILKNEAKKRWVESHTPGRAVSLIRFHLHDVAKTMFPTTAYRLSHFPMGTDKGLAPPEFCERVINVKDGERVILIGTLFKDMPMRPSVLDEYRDGALLSGKEKSKASYWALPD